MKRRPYPYVVDLVDLELEAVVEARMLTVAFRHPDLGPAYPTHLRYSGLLPAIANIFMTLENRNPFPRQGGGCNTRRPL